MSLLGTGAPRLPAQAPAPQQPQQYVSQAQSHISNGRGNEREDMLAQIRDHQRYDGQEQYSQGRMPSAASDRSYQNQHDGPAMAQDISTVSTEVWVHLALTA